MICIQRSDVPRPAWFGSIGWGRAQQALLTHLGAKASARTQKRMETITGPWPGSVVEAVWTLFKGRCAMCESAELRPGPTSVKRFRPLETEESASRYAHSYAALLWENLILLCPSCDRARGDRFLLVGPTSGTNEHLRDISFNLRSAFACRKAYDLLEGELTKARQTEQALQIDPTFDQPAQFFIFHDRGMVTPVGRRAQELAFRAEHTIETFQLNRDDLVHRRRNAAQLIGTALRPARLPKLPKDPGAAAVKLSQSHPRLAPALALLDGEFSAAKAFRMARWLHSRLPSPIASVAPHLQWPTGDLQIVKRILLPVTETLIAPSARAIPKTKAAAPPAMAAAVAVAAVVPQFSRNRITRVRIKNFRHFRSAEFELPPSRPEDAVADPEIAAMIRKAGLKNGEHLPEPTEYCGWKMLLGENGVGKSSVLQAIALALLADEAGEDAIKPLCNLSHSLSRGSSRGSIEVWVEGRVVPIRLGFTATGTRLTGALRGASSSAEPRQVLYLRAYGAARLLPPKSEEILELPRPGAQEIRNLFDAFHPLADPSQWLQALDDESQHLAFIALKELLDLPADAQLGFQDWHGREAFGLTLGGHFTPLEHFSAGYQSIVALACDIMAGFGQSVGDMQKRVGVVLLDEIGTNLHPRWRLRIVQSLRRAFPQMQFIASTHEPLCLRGLGQHEVALLTLEKIEPPASAAPPAEDSWEVRLRDDLPSPAIYRVDQLLTGDFFGLQTAYDPDEEAAFNAYHALLVRQRELGTKFPASDVALLERLRERLRNRLTLGDTIAERRVLAALEEAELRHAKKPERLKGSPEAKRAAQRLLQTISPNEGAVAP